MTITTSGGTPSVAAARSTTAAAELFTPRRILLARFGDDHEPLGAEIGIGDAEGGHAALADARDVADHFLDLLRIEIAARLDDHVLLPAGDEELAVGDVAEIARVHPAALVQDLARDLGTMKVSGGDRRSAELDPPLDALGERPARGVDHLHFVAGERASAGDEAERRSDRSAGAGSASRFSWNRARTRRSTRGPRPDGGTVSATDDSARPYTGLIASGRNP